MFELGLEGKIAVVTGGSDGLGRATAERLAGEGARVVICARRADHLRRTAEDISARTGGEVPGVRADVLVAAMGNPGTIVADMVKPGAVVIDVGMNRLESGKLVGDVEFEAAAERAAWITPVPGGVGPMTVAMLMTNTLRAAELREASQAPITPTA